MKLLVLQCQKLHPENGNTDTVVATDFIKQLTLLKEYGFNAVTCNDIYNCIMKIGSLPPKPVLITFDNGYISQYEHAMPALKANDFHAVFFVSGNASLKSCYRQNDHHHTYMNIEHLKQVQEFGFEIGLHGYDYLDFSTSSIESLRADLQRAVMLFEKVNLPVIKALAYPDGLKPLWFWKARKMYRMLMQEKILLAFTQGSGKNELPDILRLNIYRIGISGKQTEKDFIHLLKKHN